jgi:ABC-type multidrug transport system ATPase subunit
VIADSGPDAAHGTIVATGLGIRRRGRWILRSATFSIADGVIGIAGAAGAGKSTFLATLATLRRPTAGALRVCGHDVAREGAQVRKRIGLLPTRSDWATGMTVGEALTYGAYFRRAPREALAEVLERFELSDAASIGYDLLPPDLRLRTGLAVTCLHNPELVLLDEPLAGLDERTGAEISTVFMTLAPTVVVTGEATSHLAGFCRRTHSLERGRLVESPGPPRSQFRAQHASVGSAVRG